MGATGRAEGPVAKSQLIRESQLIGSRVQGHGAMGMGVGPWDPEAMGAMGGAERAGRARRAEWRNGPRGRAGIGGLYKVS